MPRSRDGGDGSPHSDPERQKYFVRRGRAGAPELGARMDQQPKCRDGRVDDADDPSDGSEQGEHELKFTAE